jgi:hypothetical protein
MQLASFGKVTSQSLGRSVLFVSACIAVVALLLVPVAARQAGTNGLQGLAAAAALCIVAAAFAEAISCIQSRSGSHLVGMALAMAVRDVPLLAICLALAVAGQDGEQHLGFVCYLLATYFVALIVETWLAVSRVNVGSQNGTLETR